MGAISHTYSNLFALLLESEIFIKQHEYYCALEKTCEGLPPLSLVEFTMERVDACELWYSKFMEQDPDRQLLGVLHNSAFFLLVAQEKSLWKM